MKTSTGLVGGTAALVLIAGPVWADALGDAKWRPWDAATIVLFTSAINSGTLTGADKELAFVKRAEAYLAAGQKTEALAAGASEPAAREKSRLIAELYFVLVPLYISEWYPISNK